MSIDPLTEEYHTWSPYVFSGNRVIDSRELEGLEPRTVHATKQAAAENFGQYYNGASILEAREYGSAIYSQQTTYSTTYGPLILTTYSYNDAAPGSEAGTNINFDIPNGATLVSEIHAHGESTAANPVTYDDNNFSPTDTSAITDIAKSIPGYTGYISTPEGSLKEFDPLTGASTTVATNLPSDPDDPGRLNTVAPVNNLEAGRQQILKDVEKAIDNFNPTQ